MQGINQYWKEGKYVDLWSINHILSGVVLGALLYHLGISFSVGIFVALFLFIGWEIAEMMLGIKEHKLNIWMDILCDLAGFLLVIYYTEELGYNISPLMTALTIGVFIIFNVWGFFAYEVRKIEKI